MVEYSLGMGKTGDRYIYGAPIMSYEELIQEFIREAQYLLELFRDN